MDYQPDPECLYYVFSSFEDTCGECCELRPTFACTQCGALVCSECLMTDHTEILIGPVW